MLMLSTILYFLPKFLRSITFFFGVTVGQNLVELFLCLVPRMKLKPNTHCVGLTTGVVKTISRPTLS